VFNSSSEFYIDVRIGNPMLKDSDFAADGYFANNFNDIVASYVTLFELMVVNQVSFFGFFASETFGHSSISLPIVAYSD
jgi:hypothetical protein